MRTGKWRLWLGVGLFVLVGVGRAAAQGPLPMRPMPVTDDPQMLSAPTPVPPPPPGPPAMHMPPGPPPDAIPDHGLFPVAKPLEEHGDGHESEHSHTEIVHETSQGCLNECCDPGAYEFWGDYLLLKAHRNAQDYAVISPDLITFPGGSIQSLDYQTQSAFRIGGGYKLPGDGVMLGATYTYLHTNDNQSISSPAGGTLYATLTRGGSYDDVTSATGMTNLNYNVLDLDVSKRFTATHSLDVTVFGGGRLAVIDQNLMAVYNGGTMNAMNATVNTPVYFYGGGLTFGGEALWKVWEGSNHTGLGLFMRARGCLVSGEFRDILTETSNNGAVTVVNVSEKVHEIVPVAEIAMGVNMEWEHFNISVGYEMSNWFNMVNSPTFPDAANIGQVGRRTSDLTIEGLAVRMGVSY